MGALPLKGNLGMQATLLEQAPPNQLVELLLPHPWASIAERAGAPSNICVDAALALRHAFGQYGIRSELQPVDLNGTVFHGYCLLVLPDSQRMVDATVGQFAQIAALEQGPLINRTAAAGRREISAIPTWSPAESTTTQPRSPAATHRRDAAPAGSDHRSAATRWQRPRCQRRIDDTLPLLRLTSTPYRSTGRNARDSPYELVHGWRSGVIDVLVDRQAFVPLDAFRAAAPLRVRRYQWPPPAPVGQGRGRPGGVSHHVPKTAYALKAPP